MGREGKEGAKVEEMDRGRGRIGGGGGHSEGSIPGRAAKCAGPRVLCAVRRRAGAQARLEPPPVQT